MSCNCNEPKDTAPVGNSSTTGCNSPKVLHTKGGMQVVQFLKVSIPATLGDDITNPPEHGRYHNTIVEYEINNNVYLYSSDGIYTKLTREADNDFNLLNNRPKYNGVLMDGSTDIPSIEDTIVELKNYTNKTTEEAKTKIAKAIADFTITMNAITQKMELLNQSVDAFKTEINEKVQGLENTQNNTIAELKEKLNKKQDRLTPSAGIKIDDEGNISVAIGLSEIASKEYVDNQVSGLVTTTNQTISTLTTTVNDLKDNSVRLVMSETDPGQNSPLPPNTLLGVYDSEA